ncbi:MAG: carboxypeptidase-like regulatory domain-containing protein [Gemmatimonadaceae bacterium]|nr:carboxypeptidase-like regulatory domain-containing protein [Gemmatimonadaceae bacterium]
MKLIGGLALFLALGAPAAAQAPRAPAFAAAEGVVQDSLHGGFVDGATVSVGNTRRFGVTDSLGRFRIDSIPAGEHQIALLHPTLDTLGVQVVTAPVAFAADSTVSLALAIPSARTVMRAKCSGSAAGSGALIGLVVNADSEEPVAGAEVRLWWIEVTVGEAVGMRQQPHQRVATTDASGRYKLCGLPPELSANIYAASGSDSTITLPITYGAPGLGMATLYLGTSDTAASAAQAGTIPAGGAEVRGVVVDSTGDPLPGARVALATRPDAVVTDSAGAFVLSGQPSGTQALVVRKLGYEPAEIIVNLTRREPHEVTVRLGAFVPVLEAVLVQARRGAALERIGFTERQRTGLGRFMTQDDLNKRFAVEVSDFLRHLPPPRENGFSDACTHYWVDGSRWREGLPDDFMTPQEVAAIEVYDGTAVPPQFQSFEGSCRVVVIWTKWKLGVR